MLGPMYGIALVWLLHHWQSRVLDQRAAGGDRDGDDPLQPAVEAEDRDTRKRSTWSAACCWRSRSGLVVVGLYNPAPDGKQVLPTYGLPLLIGALVAAVAFFVWERFASTRLIEPAGVHFRPFLAALGASLCRRRGADGDARQRRAVRSGRARPGPEPSGVPAAALPDRAAHRRPARRLDRHQGRRPCGGLRGPVDRRGRLLPDRAVARRPAGRPSRPGLHQPADRSTPTWRSPVSVWAW